MREYPSQYKGLSEFKSYSFYISLCYQFEVYSRLAFPILRFQGTPVFSEIVINVI